MWLFKTIVFVRKDLNRINFYEWNIIIAILRLINLLNCCYGFDSFQLSIQSTTSMSMWNIQVFFSWKAEHGGDEWQPIIEINIEGDNSEK